jgi:hypothetical protein
MSTTFLPCFPSFVFGIYTMTTPPTLADVEHLTSPRSTSALVHQVIFSGIGLTSDGYNAQVISSANAVLKKLYPTQFTTQLKTRLSQAYFVGIIIGERITSF